MNDAVKSGEFEQLQSHFEMGLDADDDEELFVIAPADEDVDSAARGNVLHGGNRAKWWPLLLALAGACIGYAAHPLLQFQPADANRSTGMPANASAPATSPSTIMVDVKGDVRHPGVVQLNADARVKDAIQAAGGFGHAADASQVNLAAPVDDGAEVDVPVPKQAGTSAADSPVAATTTSTAATAKLDINQADAASLETIPGIGPAKAAAIVTYRQQHGPFSKISDLVQVPGIGPATLTRIQTYLSIGS